MMTKSAIFGVERRGADQVVGMRTRTKLMAGSLLCSLAAVSTGAHAQSASPADVNAQTRTSAEEQPGEIIVTARRKTESALEVPATIDVFTGSRLESAGISSTADLAIVTPGLQFVPGSGGTNIALRGVSSNATTFGANPSVAVHFDGVYLPQPDMALGELFDLRRVEILKGPQGTLYGRNATGGAINLIPETSAADLNGAGFIGYGRFNLLTGRLAVGLPLGSNAGLRISGAFARDDGYTRSILHSQPLDNKDIQTVRAVLTARLGLGTMRFAAQYVDDKSGYGAGYSIDPALSQPGYFYANSIQRLSPRLIATDLPSTRRAKGILSALNLSYPVGNWEVRSISGFSDYRVNSVLDSDGAGNPTGGPFDEYQEVKQTSRFVSQEFQALSDPEAAVRATLGAYYSHEKAVVDFFYSFPSDGNFIARNQFTTMRSRSIAGFANVEADISEQFTLVGGLRYTDEGRTGELFDRRNSRTTIGHADAAKLTGSGQLLWKPSLNTMLYAGYSTSFKAGGFLTSSRIIDTYGPEILGAYEIGAKGRSGALVYEVSAFYYDYEAIQLRATDTSSGLPITRITNDASAEVKGVEARILYNFSNELELNAGMLFLDSKIKNFVNAQRVDVSGVELPLAPKWTLTAGVSYTISVSGNRSLRLGSDIKYQSRILLPSFVNIPLERQAGYALWNASAKYDLSSNTYVTIIASNITNKLYATSKADFQRFGFADRYGAPRTYEFRLGFRF